MSEFLGKLHHIAICVTDLKCAEPFYTSILGWLGYAEGQWMEDTFIFYAGPGGGIGIWPADHNPPNPKHHRYSPGLHHLCLAADNREQVDAFHRHLQEIGAEILDAPAEYDYLPDYYAVFFADPDGIKLELCHTPGFPPG